MTTVQDHLEDVFAGGGEVAALLRSLDWSKTALGPVAGWPQSLRTTINLLLNSRYPMFVFWGPELIKIYNDAYRPITGGKHPGALGRPGPEVWPEIWDAIGPMVERVVVRAEATWSDDLMLFMHRHGFPEEVYFTFSYSPVRGENGHVAGMFCACTETTAKVVGERRLRILRDLAAAPADARGVHEACKLSADVIASTPNEVAFAALYLCDGESLWLEASSGIAGFEDVFDALAGGEGGATAPALREVLRTGSQQRIDDLAAFLPRIPPGPWPEPPHRVVILPIVDRGRGKPVGALVLAPSSRRPFDDGYGDFFRLVASQISTSVANAHAIESERRRAEELAALDRAKTTFFSNVSHEFRTPLTLMLGPAEDLLAELHGPLAVEQRRELAIVHRNGLRLQKLVNALLDFARLEAGRVDASYEPTDLAAFTRELASAFEGPAERAGVALVIDCPPLDEPVFVDRAMWEKIVLNLLSNALKFTFEGRIEVSLRAAPGSAVLSVEDSGVGIPAAELPRVFDRFHRIEGTRARTHEGSGIGLALVQELARLHAGSVSARSELGKGTTFTVTIPKGMAHLPKEHVKGAPAHTPSAMGAAPFVEEALGWVSDGSLVRSRDAASGPAPPSAGPELGMADSMRAATILLVDDNSDMRAYVRRLLERFWTVDAVADGARALALARATIPDLVLTDIMMPELDGFALLRALRDDERTRAIPIVMLSARSGDEAKIHGLRAGADDYLTKPFSAGELVARVRTHLELARLRRAITSERDRLRSLLGQAPAIINFLRGPELVIEYMHPKAQQILRGRAVVGRPLLEALPEFRDQEFPALLRRVIDTGERIDRQERLVRHDVGGGEMRESYWSFAYLPIRNEDGAVEGVMTFDVDVTDQVLARRRVQESEERFRNMADHAPVMVWVTEADGHCTFLSQSWYDFTGQTPATSLGYGWLDAVHPDDAQRSRDVFIAANSRRQGFRLEYRLRRRDGVYRWAIDTASPRLSPNGEFLGYIGSVIDITERREQELALAASEVKHRQIFEGAEVSLWEQDFSAVKQLVDELRDGDGQGLRGYLEAHPSVVERAVGLVRVRDVNPATLRMFEASSKEQLLQSLHQVFLPETFSVFRNEMVAIAEGRRTHREDTALRTLSGKRVEVAFTIGLPANGGGWDRVYVTLLDRSPEKAVERERAARLVEVERALQFSEMFSAILGHDLRNPLSAITMAVSLLEMRAESETIAMPLKRIVAGAQRMERMISQLLDFTRIRLGRGLPLERARCDLGALARSIIDELEPVWKREIALEVSGDPSGVWDGDRLSQLLSNLAANACQHGAKDVPVTIRIDATRGDAVELEVSNGGAIPPEVLPVLFEPMGRVAQGRDRRDGSSGLGLGLYITQQIALAHGGSIAVEAGQLTRFVLSLPRQGASESTQPAAASIFSRAQEGTPS